MRSIHGHRNTCTQKNLHASLFTIFKFKVTFFENFKFVLLGKVSEDRISIAIEKI